MIFRRAIRPSKFQMWEFQAVVWAPTRELILALVILREFTQQGIHFLHFVFTFLKLWLSRYLHVIIN